MQYEFTVQEVQKHAKLNNIWFGDRYTYCKIFRETQGNDKHKTQDRGYIWGMGLRHPHGGSLGSVSDSSGGCPGIYLIIFPQTDTFQTVACDLFLAHFLKRKVKRERKENTKVYCKST